MSAAQEAGLLCTYLTVHICLIEGCAAKAGCRRVTHTDAPSAADGVNPRRSGWVEVGGGGGGGRVNTMHHEGVRLFCFVIYLFSLFLTERRRRHQAYV